MNSLWPCFLNPYSDVEASSFCLPGQKKVALFSIKLFQGNLINFTSI